MTPFASAPQRLYNAMARAIAPRKALTVSAWADAHRFLSSKGSAEAGRWRTDRNPLQREIMDALSNRSPVREVVVMFPIQMGKTEIAANFLGYTMDHDPGPIMVCLPGEVSQKKWVNQKLAPMIEATPVVRDALTSIDSRDSSNTRTFKDFSGGQLYIEHAGSPQRLKSTSVKKLIVDEVDEFANNFTWGDDPIAMLEGRTSAFPTSSKVLWIGTPGTQGVSRLEAKWLASDQRLYYVPCPHCGELQPLTWAGLQWNRDSTHAWYVCRENGCVIEEYDKPAMIAAGQWIPENPAGSIRGYTANCLYYPLGLGPRWLDMARKFLEAKDDPAKLKTFTNDRLAELWEDRSMRAVKHNLVADRAEPYALRTAPQGVLFITAGVDTQDDRFEVQLVGWGRGLAAWTLDYVVVRGDPNDDDTRHALATLLAQPIQHESGHELPITATWIDAAGHRTNAVKAFVRDRGVVTNSQGETTKPLRTLIAGFGAKPNNAPVISKGKMEDVDWKGQYDKSGVVIHHAGTVGIKQVLYARLASDADKPPEKRLVHTSRDLEPEYFAGLVSETYNPSKNRYEKKRGARNEPLDTWVYAYAATHHASLRAHRFTQRDWEVLEARLVRKTEAGPEQEVVAPPPIAAPTPANRIRRLGKVGRGRF